MRTLIIVLSGILSVGACQRPEEPHSRVHSPATETATSLKQVDTAPPAAETATHRQQVAAAVPPAAETARDTRCVVPTPTESPPAARPAASCPTDPLPTPPTLPQGRVVFVDAPGHPSVSVEIARTPDHRQRGLMYRTALPADAGMLFTWSSAATRSFWMRNTCIPLDMLFLAEDGTIAGILEQVPPMNELSRTIPCPARHVLELPAGYSRQHGVKAGQKVHFQES